MPALFSAITAYQDNQLDKPLAAHQATDGEAFPPQELVRSRSQSTADNLARKGTDDDTNDITPGYSVIKEAEIGAQSRQCKVEWQEEDRDKILDLLGQLDSKPPIVRADQSD